MSFIKTAKYSINIDFKLNPDCIYAIVSSDTFKKLSWDFFSYSKEKKYRVNFLFSFFILNKKSPKNNS